MIRLRLLAIVNSSLTVQLTILNVNILLQKTKRVYLLGKQNLEKSFFGLFGCYIWTQWVFVLDESNRKAGNTYYKLRYDNYIILCSTIYLLSSSWSRSGLCLRHFNTFISLFLRTLDQRADNSVQMHPPPTLPKLFRTGLCNL